MSYSQIPVSGYFWDFQTSPPFDEIANNWPSTFRYYLQSAWFEFTNEDNFDLSQSAFNSNPPIVGGAEAISGVLMGMSNVGGNSNIQIQLGDGNFYNTGASTSFINITYQGPLLTSNTWYNIIVSIDSIAGIVQVFLNGSQLTTIVSSNIYNSTSMAQPQGDNNSGNPFQLFCQILRDPGCVADAYWTSPAAFFDLTNPSNLAKFINLDGSPVDLGNTASNVLGVDPLIYLTIRFGGVLSDFLTNKGSASGTFYVPFSGPLNLCNQPDINISLNGVSSNVAIGTTSVSIVNPSLIDMKLLQAIEYTQSDQDRFIALRYSNTGGANWGNKVLQSTGKTGELETNVQFQRLGMGRDRVFEVSFSGDFKTAITGLFVDTEVLSS